MGGTVGWAVLWDERDYGMGGTMGWVVLWDGQYYGMSNCTGWAGSTMGWHFLDIGR